LHQLTGKIPENSGSKVNKRRRQSYCDKSPVSHWAFSSRLQVASQSYFSPVSHISLHDWLRGLPRDSETPGRISMKIGIYNFFSGVNAHRHANPHGATTTWAVWAISQFATVEFLYVTFCFINSPTGRAVGPILTVYTSWRLSGRGRASHITLFLNFIFLHLLGPRRSTYSTLSAVRCEIILDRALVKVLLSKKTKFWRQTLNR